MAVVKVGVGGTAQGWGRFFSTLAVSGLIFALFYGGAQLTQVGVNLVGSMLTEF